MFGIIYGYGFRVGLRYIGVSGFAFRAWTLGLGLFGCEFGAWGFWSGFGIAIVQGLGLATRGLLGAVTTNI